jgi:hypothetical protein
MWTDPGNIKIARRHMNVEIGTVGTEAAQFPEKRNTYMRFSLQCGGMGGGWGMGGFQKGGVMGGVGGE